MRTVLAVILFPVGVFLTVGIGQNGLSHWWYIVAGVLMGAAVGLMDKSDG